jgi:hypothetical protein
MEPTDFEQPSTKLRAPEGHEASVLALPIYRYVETHDGTEVPIVVSCWRATWRERLSVLLFGRVWLRVWGQTHPPIALDATQTIFNKGRKLR